MTTSTITPGIATIPAPSTNSATSLLVTLSGLLRRRRLADATASWSEADFRRILRHWLFHCRRDQSVPGVARRLDPWTIWLMLGGRGAGKTRTGAEWVRGVALGEPDFAELPLRRIALVGETFADARNVMVEGPSGILAVGVDEGGTAYVLEDATASGLKPPEWAARAVGLYRRLQADALIVETNQGGEMATGVIREVDPSVPVL